MTTDPDWITITPDASRFPQRHRRSFISAYGLMESSIGSGRIVAFVKVDSHAIIVKETLEQLAERLE